MICDALGNWRKRYIINPNGERLWSGHTTQEGTHW